MYRDYFGFAEKPFNITPNPRFIYLSHNHKEVFAHLLYGIRNHCGFIEITGEIGTGKTTVLRTLLDELQDDAYRLALIFNPCLSVLELLRAVNREFGLAADAASPGELVAELNRFLLAENAAGRTVVLVIDEAQNLEPAVLEQIRLLSNLETDTDKLIQIILVGQPELAEILSRPDLRQLSQRVTVRYHLQPMDFADSCRYIAHRLEVAGAKRRELFSPAALKRIFRATRGYPRLLNILCDRALLVAFSEEAAQVTPAMVSTAEAELQRQQGRARFPWRRGLVGGLALLLLAGLWWGQIRLPLGQAVSLGQTPPLQVLRDELVAQGTQQSFTTAVDALLACWQVPPLGSGEGAQDSGGLQALAAQRGLLTSPFRGGLDELLALDTPALLELLLPGEARPRYLALTGRDHEGLRVVPALGGASRLDRRALDGLWTGQAHLLWRNYEAIPALAVPGGEGPEVARLQQLLVGLGFDPGSRSGRFDAATVAAVTRFQAAQGIVQDGRVGPQTLMALYRAARQYAPPTLSESGGGA